MPVMTNDIKQGFAAEGLAFILAYIGNLSEVNMVLETVLLSGGIVSMGYGFYKFLKKPKK